jgi:hypothetical protein
MDLQSLEDLNSDLIRSIKKFIHIHIRHHIRHLNRKTPLLFFDIGNAIDEFDHPLQYSAGIGLRFRLPVVTLGVDIAQPLTNPVCRSVTPDPRCTLEAGFDSNGGPRLHLNFSPKL